MSLELVKEEIRKLNNFYIENDENNFLDRYKFNDKYFILEKSEVTELLEEIFNLEHINFNQCKYLINRLEHNSFDSTELNMIHNIKMMFEDYTLNRVYCISKVKRNKEIKRINNIIRDIYGQCRNFDSFSQNQDKFDNMISIIKITKRIKTNQNYTIDKNFDFDYEEDNSLESKKKILLEANKLYNGIRFQI